MATGEYANIAAATIARGTKIFFISVLPSVLPILLYPVTIPVIIAGVRGTAALLQSPPEEPVATLWIGLLTAFDVVFITLALWTFEPLMTE